MNRIYNLPENSVTGNPTDPTDQTIIRMDLFYTREDGVKTKIGFWFDGKKQFELLKTIYRTEAIIFIPEPLRNDLNVTGIPPIALNQITLDTLGKYLASLARLNKLNKPGLIAKYRLTLRKKLYRPKKWILMRDRTKISRHKQVL